jgi:ketosteroid isomerase-like protein
VEAFNRRDIDALFVGYHNDFELQPAREMVDAGLADASYRRRAGYLKYVSDWSEVWGGSRRVEPVELIDLGNRFVLLGHTPGRAQSSGLALTEAYAAICTFKDGKLVRQREFVDHGEALEAAGLSGGSIE